MKIQESLIEENQMLKKKNDSLQRGWLYLIFSLLVCTLSLIAVVIQGINLKSENAQRAELNVLQCKYQNSLIEFANKQTEIIHIYNPDYPIIKLTSITCNSLIAP